MTTMKDIQQEATKTAVILAESPKLNLSVQEQALFIAAFQEGVKWSENKLDTLLEVIKKIEKHYNNLSDQGLSELI